MAKSNKKTKSSSRKKTLGLRIFIVVVAALLALGVVIIPIRSNIRSSAEESGESITVRSFETGKLADAVSEAADGTDYNFIKNVAVLSGTLNADDFAAFASIPNLEILELAGTETEDGIIPENALTSKNQLSFVSLPKNTVEIGSNAFSSNRKLVKITMPDSVTKIDDYAFASCEALENFPISEKVEYIGAGAFQDCKAITEFVIPYGITEIYPDTFSKCGFESISIGPNVEKIGAGVFADCNSLKTIYSYAEEAPALDGDVFRNVSADIHCYPDSEESYQSWKLQNMTVTGDLTGEYEAPEEAAEETAAAETVSDTEADEADDESAEAEITETEAAETEAETEDTEAAPASAEAGESNSGISVGIVIVIVIMAMIIAVLATILVMNSKKNKQ